MAYLGRGFFSYALFNYSACTAARHCAGTTCSEPSGLAEQASFHAGRTIISLARDGRGGGCAVIAGVPRAVIAVPRWIRRSHNSRSYRGLAPPRRAPCRSSRAPNPYRSGCHAEAGLEIDSIVIAIVAASAAVMILREVAIGGTPGPGSARPVLDTTPTPTPVTPAPLLLVPAHEGAERNGGRRVGRRHLRQPHSKIGVKTNRKQCPLLALLRKLRHLVRPALRAKRPRDRLGAGALARLRGRSPQFRRRP